MAPDREANIANSGKFIDLLHNKCIEAILMSTLFVFLIYRKNFVGTQNRVRIIHGE